MTPFSTSVDADTMGIGLMDEGVIESTLGILSGS
jgi:hypothetical protein